MHKLYTSSAARLTMLQPEQADLFASIAAAVDDARTLGLPFEELSDAALAELKGMNLPEYLDEVLECAGSNADVPVVMYVAGLAMERYTQAMLATPEDTSQINTLHDLALRGLSVTLGLTRSFSRVPAPEPANIA